MNWKLLSLALLGMTLVACDGKEEKKKTVETKPLDGGGVVEKTTVEKKPVNADNTGDKTTLDTTMAEPSVKQEESKVEKK